MGQIQNIEWQLCFGITSYLFTCPYLFILKKKNSNNNNLKKIYIYIGKTHVKKDVLSQANIRNTFSEHKSLQNSEVGVW